MTPNLALIHVHHPHWRGFRLWIPLFLLWIPLLLVAPLLVVVLLAASFVWRVPVGRAIRTYWSILCALPGTEVRVQAQGNHIQVRIL